MTSATAILDNASQSGPTFAELRAKAWKYSYAARIIVTDLVGGTPSDPNVAEGWIRTKLGAKAEEEIQALVAQVKEERGVSEEEAIKIANQYKNLNGFKRDANGLYIDGRQAKAMLKEAASCAVAAGTVKQRGYGKTNKALLGFLAEHVFVAERRLHIGSLNDDGTITRGLTEADHIQQRFVSTWRGTGIQYEEVIAKAVLDMTVKSDWAFSRKEWGAIWISGEMQGIGASRSQGYGTFTLASWVPLGEEAPEPEDDDAED